jgi:hypothetical protein
VVIATSAITKVKTSSVELLSWDSPGPS